MAQVNFSQYKLSTSGSPTMSASNYNGLFSAVMSAIQSIESDQSLDNSEYAVTLPNYSNGDALTASALTTLVSSLSARLLTLANEVNYSISLDYLTYIDNSYGVMTSKSAGNNVTVAEWNGFIDEVQYNINGIIDQIEENEAWKFGDSMPIVLS